MGLTRTFTGITAVAVAGLAVSGGVAGAGERGAPATAPRALEKAVFNNPYVDSGQKIVKYLVRLIDGAADGSRIELTAFDFADESVAKALIRAHEDRQVSVRVVADGKIVDAPLLKKLGAALEDDTGSWIKVCHSASRDYACIGGNRPGHKDARMHNKFFLFSRTLGASGVVVQSSANLNESSGTKMWNSAYAVADPDLHAVYQRYFTELAAKKKQPDYYHTETGKPVPVGRFKVYHSPRGPEKGGKQNTAYNILGNVKCKGNTEGGAGDDHRTIIRVATWQFSSKAGEQIAQRLWDLDKKGCYVDIVASHLKDGTRKILLKKPGGYHGPEVREFEGSPGLHEKTMLIDGNYAGDKNQKVVWTGSFNFNFKSLRENDETWLRIKSTSVHTSFKHNFWDVQCAPKVKTWQAVKDPCKA